jgi:hypothetical protein
VPLRPLGYEGARSRLTGSHRTPMSPVTSPRPRHRLSACTQCRRVTLRLGHKSGHRVTTGTATGQLPHSSWPALAISYRGLYGCLPPSAWRVNPRQEDGTMSRVPH